jgi:hypothetical protein
MDGLMMMSILLFTVAVPVVAARDGNGRRGARRMLLGLLAVNALYLAYVSVIHVAVTVPQRW